MTAIIRGILIGISTEVSSSVLSVILQTSSLRTKYLHPGVHSAPLSGGHSSKVGDTVIKFFRRFAQDFVPPLSFYFRHL